jgi:hypothetical protein
MTGASAPEADHASRFAYLLVTHREPLQIEALTDRILELSPHAQVVVHHDLAAPLVPWNGRPPERVHLVERRRVLWGDWSIVDATLRMIDFSARTLDADWFVVLSGEHWPVVDLARWERSIAADGVDALVESQPLRDHLRFGHPDDNVNRFLARCVHRWVTFGEPKATMLRRILDGLAKMSGYVQPLAAVDYSHRRGAWLVGLPRRRGPLRAWTFHKGSQWIACNRRAADTILSTDARIPVWFGRSHIPDETYLQTVLRNDRSLTIRDRTTTYVPSGPRYPEVKRWMLLDHEDLPAVRASGAAFARKVDTVNRPSVIRAIDREVDRMRDPKAERRDGRDVELEARAEGYRLRSERKLCVAVVGMHRSGTSATAGLLIGQGAAGPPADDLVPPSPSNERGHWESRTVNNINTRLLAAIGATAYAPPAQLPNWLTDEFEELRDEATRWFTASWDDRPLVLKDPRVCVTMPFWRTAIPAQMGVVLVLRDPEDVARSLHSRDNVPMLLGLAMWDRYVRTVVEDLDGLPTLVLEYEAMLREPTVASRAVSDFLAALGVDVTGSSAPDVAAGRLDPSLRHHHTEQSDYADVAGSQREIYTQLSSLAGYQPAWRAPKFEPAPPWVEDTLRLRRELESAWRELHWVQASRAYRLAGALWRRTGERPSGLAGADHVAIDEVAHQ